MFAWLRLMAALAVMGCSVAATRAGCYGHPQNLAIVPMPVPRDWWAARHLAKKNEAHARGSEVQLLLVGDSITNNYERDGPEPAYRFKLVWNDLLAPHHAMNLGLAGDYTGNMLWRLQHGEVDGLTPRDIVLLGGINNVIGTLNGIAGSAEDIAAGVQAVAEELHRRMPAARITVMALLPTGLPQPAQQLAAQVNTLVERWVASAPWARWLTVDDVFLDHARLRTELYYDPVMTPGSPALHPNPEGQRRMAERLIQSLYGIAYGAGNGPAR